MPLTDAQRRASNKYNLEHMTVLGCKVRKEDAEKFKKACAAKHTTPNEQFKKVVKAFIAEYEETPSD
jgi:methylmalonyl-CoA mutase cobalamin-binding subunit